MSKKNLGKLPNQRAGRVHIHSGEVTCGIAYIASRSSYLPCTRLVNHDGPCGYEDNTAT